MSLLDLLSTLPKSVAAKKPKPMWVGVQDPASKKTYVERSMQWFPESLQETGGADWDEKKIPGGSHPLYNYQGGQGRSFSFTLVLTSDEDPELGTMSSGKDNAYGVRNLDIRQELGWVRSLCAAMYNSAEGGLRVAPPPVVRLRVENIGWGADNGAEVYCLFQTYDIAYEKLWPSNYPRLVTVSLQCVETVQESGKIQFLGRRGPADWKQGLKRG
jgi:hypothetical protein